LPETNALHGCEFVDDGARRIISSKVLAAGGDGKISRLTEQSVGLYIVYLHDFE
jgi:hypothetical protein